MKNQVKPIIQEVDYGIINLNLDRLMQERKISTYELSNKANIRFQTLQLLKDNRATRLDFKVLAKLCYALDCNVSDLIKYDENI